jgi:glycosyltransferase involved in cell wall biosynthesis
MAKISSVIICHNELDCIGHALKSLEACDEIWVVDSYSTDGTAAYVQDHFPKVKVVQRTFVSYAEQKTWAIEQCSQDWIFLLDADEWIEWEWAEVKSALETENSVAFSFRRLNYYMGKRMRFSGLQNDRVTRLIHRNHNRFNQRWVHESIISEGKVTALPWIIHHNTYKNLTHQIQKINAYSSLKAREKQAKNKRVGFASVFYKPLWMFFKLYGFRLGFLDGKQGFLYCYFSALSVFLRQIRLWRKEES